MTTIRHIIYAGHLSDLDDVDKWEAEAYGELVGDAIVAAYPTADVTVEVRHGVSGAGAGTSVYADEDDVDEDAIREDVDSLAGDVFERGEWRA